MSNVLRQILLWGSILIGVMFITQRIFFFKHGFLEKTVGIITYPVLIISNSLTSPIKNFFKQPKKPTKLCTQTENVSDLIDENIKLKATLNRYKSIRDLVEFKKRYKAESGVIGKVLVKNFTDVEHSILINKGSREKIRKNMVAIHNTQLVGRVSEVFPYHCKVILITDTGCKVAARTSNSKANGIVVGTNTVNSCTLSYVSHLQKIDDHDLVISSGQGLVFPEGFCLGRIAQHTVEGLCYNIDIEPLIDFTNLEFCVLLDRDSTINF